MLSNYFNKGLPVRIKRDKTIVTLADEKADEFIRAKLLDEFKGSTVVSEESGVSKGSGRMVWVVDPLDKTRFFTMRIPLFSTQAAMVKDGEPVLSAVYFPLLGDMYYSEKGCGAFLNGQRIRVSRTKELGKARINIISKPDRKALEIAGSLLFRTNKVYLFSNVCAWVADARIDAYISTSHDAWSSLPNQILVKEAGGKVTDFSGGEVEFGADMQGRSSVICSNGAIHESLLEAVQGKRRG